MKTRYRFLIYTYLCAGIFFMACTDPNEPDSNKILINPSQSKVSSVGEIAYAIEYIPLSLPIIGEIGSKIIHLNNRFFIHAKYPACIHVFDKTGGVISNICQQGEGPGKYESISDFIVAPTGDALYVLSRNSFKIMKYALDGSFMEDYKIPVYANKFQLLNEDVFALYCGNEKTEYNDTKIVFFHHRTGEIKPGPFPINVKEARYLNFFDRNNFLKPEDSQLYFFYGFNDTIFRLNELEAVPHRIVDFDKHTIPASFFDQGFEDVIDFLSKVRDPSNDFAARIIGYFETASHIHFTFEFRQEFLMLFYDKSTKTYKLSSKIKDDMVFEDFSVYQGVDDGPKGVTEDGKFIFVKEAGYVRTHLDSLQQVLSVEAFNNLLEEHSTIKPLNEHLDMNSNPVLLLIAPKSFR